MKKTTRRQRRAQKERDKARAEHARRETVNFLHGKTRLRFGVHPVARQIVNLGRQNVLGGYQ